MLIVKSIVVAATWAVGLVETSYLGEMVCLFSVLVKPELRGGEGRSCEALVSVRQQRDCRLLVIKKEALHGDAPRLEIRAGITLECFKRQVCNLLDLGLLILSILLASMV